MNVYPSEYVKSVSALSVNTFSVTSVQAVPNEEPQKEQFSLIRCGNAELLGDFRVSAVLGSLAGCVQEHVGLISKES